MTTLVDQTFIESEWTVVNPSITFAGGTVTLVQNSGAAPSMNRQFAASGSLIFMGLRDIVYTTSNRLRVFVYSYDGMTLIDSFYVYNPPNFASDEGFGFYLVPSGGGITVHIRLDNNPAEASIDHFDLFDFGDLGGGGAPSVYHPLRQPHLFGP